MPGKSGQSVGIAAPVGVAARILYAAGGLIAALGLAVESLSSRLASGPWEGLVPLFSLSYEGNIPTWYASCLLFWCGLTLAGIAREARDCREPGHRHWLLLALLFFYVSMDEAVGIHEHFGGLVEAGGWLYFDWVVPVGIAVAALGAVFLPFLRKLPKPTRNRFLLAGALYVGGALVMELPLGWWTSRHGADNLGYALIDWVEEVLELAGATLFLTALRGEAAARTERAGVPG